MAVTLTVGTSGRNYSTWQSAIALGIPANISSSGSNTPYILAAYNDSEFYSTSGTLISVTGITTDATNTITLTAATGQSFVDNVNAQTNALSYSQANGVGLRVNAGYTGLAYTNVPNVNISRLQMYLQGYGGVYCLQTDDHNYVSQCILQMTNSNASGSAVYFPGTSSTVENTVVYAASSGLRGVTAAYDTLEMCNCTVVAASDVSNTNYGIAGSSQTWTLYNTAVFGFGTNFYMASGTYSGSNNASDQAITFGSSNQASKTYSSQFQSVTSSSPDFRLVSGSALVDTGATESSIITASNDIVGTSRPQGSAWDIGAWELKSSSQSYSYTASGGISFAGASSTSRSRLYTSTGGVSFSGSAAKAYGKAYLAAGGILLGGAAVIVRSRLKAALGGVIFSGAASVVSHHAGTVVAKVLKRWLYLVGRR